MSTNARQKKVLAVDWDKHTLRLVHATVGKRGVKIDKLLAVGVPSDVATDDPQQMGALIRRTLNQEGIGTKFAVVDIPRDQAILKTLHLPTGQPDALPGMVEIQIAKELPFSVSDAVVDFAVSAYGSDGGSGDVLVGAVRNEAMQQIESTFHAAGLKLDRVGLRPYANTVAVNTLLEHGMPDRVVFIDVRRSFMEIDVIRHGVLSFSRSASVMIPENTASGEPRVSVNDRAASAVGEEAVSFEGGPSLSRVVDPQVAPLLVELTRSIEAYRASEPGAVMDHVVIGGDTGVEEAFAEAIQERMQISTQFYNPATSFGWEPDEGVAASAFAASLGLVLGHAAEGKLHFDFLHPKRTVSVAQERLRRAPLVAAVVVLFIGAAGVVFAGMTKPSRDKLASLNAQIAELEEHRKDNEAFLSLVNDINTFDQKQIVWIDVLDELVSILPSNQEIVINQLDMDQKNARITMKTRTKNRDTSTDIVRALRAYRREGRDKPRFDGSVGQKTEKKGEPYPFYQDISVVILDDSPRGVRPKAKGEDD